MWASGECPQAICSLIGEAFRCTQVVEKLTEAAIEDDLTISQAIKRTSPKLTRLFWHAQFACWQAFFKCTLSSKQDIPLPVFQRRVPQPA